MKKIYPVFCLLIANAISVNGQTENLQVINSTGGTSENEGYSIEWSVGEISSVNQMNSEDSTYLFTNGFVQPMQLSDKNLGTNVSSDNIRIFPNPATDILEIDFLQSISGKILIQLSNNAGQVIYTDEVMVHGFGFIKKINMKSFIKGNYSLRIQKIILGSEVNNPQPSFYKIVKL